MKSLIFTILLAFSFSALAAYTPNGALAPANDEVNQIAVLPIIKLICDEESSSGSMSKADCLSMLTAHSAASPVPLKTSNYIHFICTLEKDQSGIDFDACVAHLSASLDSTENDDLASL